MTEHEDVIAALRAHPVIGPRLDSAVAGWSLDPGNVLGLLVSAMLSEADDLSDDCFERVFPPFYAWLTREAEDVVVIAPLSGLDADDMPIALGPGVEIDRMSDAEVIACLTTRVISGFGSGTQTYVDPRLAIRIRERHPVGEGFLSADPLSGRIEPIEAVVNALRILKAGKVHVPGFVDMPAAPYRRTYRWTPISSLPHRPFKTYELESGDVEPLVALWAGLRDERVTVRRNQKPLRTAIRRFGFAGERSRPDDQILDLMIAAEALFLAGEKTENRDKLSLRAALFLDDELAQPARQIAQFFRSAYDIRSDLAHGGEVNEDELRPLDDVPGTVERYALVLADYLRLVLRRMIEHAARGQRQPFHDWDEFTFGRFAGGDAE